MTSLFITGNDTNAGKTVVTSLLLHYLYQKTKSAISQKWIQCGPDADLTLHDQISELPSQPSVIQKARSPYIFQTPSSPHLASQIENKTIESAHILSCTKVLESHFDDVLIEGAGGFLVPYNNTSLIADIVTDQNYPVLIVCENRVGTLNQCLMTYECIQSRGLNCMGIILNTTDPTSHPKSLQENQSYLSNTQQLPIIGSLPYADYETLKQSFMPIGDQLFQTLSSKKT